MAMLGLDSPLLRWMMSGAQTKANKSPVNNMGVGQMSSAQRAASGNKAIKAGSREAKALATARGKKKKGRMRASARRDAVVPPSPQPPVQLPIDPNDEELGLEDVPTI